MPYYARKHQLQRSLIYHAYNRSNARIKVFHSDKDYGYFLSLLKEYNYRFEVKLYHWAVMPNHYHLLLELAKPEHISKYMAGLNRAYTCYYHRSYFTAGFLWQGRFKLQPVQQERYLIACARYIERNPVRAKITTKAEEYPYSSAHFYCHHKTDGITTEDPAYLEFSKDTAGRQETYRNFLSNFNEEEERLFENLEQPQGNREFINRLIKQNGRYRAKRRGRPRERIV